MENQSKPLEDTENRANEDYDPSADFRLIEEDYTQVVQELSRHDRLGRFANEFQRLMDALKESHIRERELTEKNKTLHSQIETNASKLTEAALLSQSAHEAIDKLQKEVTTAWRMVDTAHTREQLAQETINNLRLQGSRLTQELETLRKMGSDQDQEVGAISKNKEALAREKERLLNEIQLTKEKYAIAMKFQEELERKNEAIEAKLSDTTTELEANKSELAKEKHFKEKLEEETRDLRTELAAKELELQNQTVQTNNLMKNINKTETLLREEKVINDKQTKEYQELQNAFKLQKMEYEQLNGNNERLQQDLLSKTQEIKFKEDDISKLKNEMKKLVSLKDSLENKLSKVRNEKSVLEAKKKDMQSKLINCEKEVVEMAATATTDKMKIDSLNREKEMMTKTVQKTTIFSQEQQKFISVQQINNKKIQEELQDQIENVNKQKADISALQNEKSRLVSENITLSTQIQKHLEELKLKEMELFDYKKQITNTDAKIKLHSALYEQMRSERNQLSKTLAEANDEINELKHKLKVKSYQGQQLKEDIQTKENLLVKEEFTVKRVTKEKEEIKGDLQKVLNQLKEKKDEVTLLTQEENRLQKIIQEADKDRVKITRDLNQVSNERDILGTQLVRRNDELALLYEKIKILQSVLQKGESQYGQRVEDIRLLKIEIKKLRQEKAMLARSMNNIADLRQEIFHLERDFINERMKCRMLEEELQNPLNVHRWRKLEGSDPTTYELIQKIQILQKRLIKASEEAIKRESQLKEVERLYLNLRNLLAKQPGPETFEKLKKCQSAFKQRGVKMKCLIAELTMFENQVSGYKFEKEQTEKDLREVKKKFFQLKKREQKIKLREKELAQEKTFLPVLEPITGKHMRAKFMGAGFNVASVPCIPRTPVVNS